MIIDYLVGRRWGNPTHEWQISIFEIATLAFGLLAMTGSRITAFRDLRPPNGVAGKLRYKKLDPR
jgi:hypothetical protein